MGQAPTAPEMPKRKQIRLRYFDYGNMGAYYVTICTYGRKCFLSLIQHDTIKLTSYGVIADEELHRTITMRENLSLGPYVIMPNHIHLILLFNDRSADELTQSGDDPIRKFGGSQAGSLSSIIGNFKSAVTSRIRAKLGRPDARIWQGRFYEHVIRDEKDYIRIADYIETNPITWHYDHENPVCVHASNP